jgi:hypothetical protein
LEVEQLGIPGAEKVRRRSPPNSGLKKSIKTFHAEARRRMSSEVVLEIAPSTV